jgi:hypothetical protein
MRFDAKNIGGTVELREDTAILWIEGSGTILSPFQRNDWLRTNFMVVPCAGVHLGYLVAALRVMRHPDVKPVLRECKRVRLVGHSLGGSVCEVLAALIFRVLRKSVESHNLGGPAPWRRSLIWRLIIAEDHMRWYHCGTDPVPFAMLWNRHAGNRVHLPGISLNPIENHIHGYNEKRRSLTAAE